MDIAILIARMTTPRAHRKPDHDKTKKKGNAMSTLPTFAFGFIALTSMAMLALVWSRARHARRADYIRTYMFPPGLLDKLGRTYPQLQLKDRQIVARALRQFFLAHLQSGRKFVSMPSQVADELWHEFILYTRHYEEFCKQAFGRMMHHTPAVVLGTARQHNEGLRRTWWYTCIEENINPRSPTRLPLLFALDTKFNIPNGFRYSPNCQALRAGGDAGVYCGSDFHDAGFDGSIDGFGDGHGTSDASGGDSGCGGGCGGGD